MAYSAALAVVGGLGDPGVTQPDRSATTTVYFSFPGFTTRIHIYISSRGRKLGDPARQKRNESISKITQDSMISIAAARESAGEPPYLPLTLHFSSRASSASATERGIPTTTSALLVRRLKRGNEPASGPGT